MRWCCWIAGSAREIASVLLIDNDAVRQWREIFETEGVDGLAGFHFGGRQAFLSDEQQGELSDWVAAKLPRSTREVGDFVEQRFGVRFDSRSGLVELLHRLDFVHRKPAALSTRMDPDKQRAFIAAYDNLLNQLADDEMVMFADAVHPVHGARPVGCWVRRGEAVAVEQTTGRDHLNIHGALDLESGQTQMLLVDSDAPGQPGPVLFDRDPTRLTGTAGGGRVRLVDPADGAIGVDSAGGNVASATQRRE